MSEDLNSEISDSEKMRIVSDFILHSPPGEFNEVFNDIRVLLNNDKLLKDEASAAFAQYNKDQFCPVDLENSSLPVIISDHNDLGSGKFYDPHSKQSFKFDFLRRESSECEPYENANSLEKWRSTIELEFLQYTQNHYKHGVCSVFSKVVPAPVPVPVPVSTTKTSPSLSSSSNNLQMNGACLANDYIAICIEDHQFQPNNYWNGRWRSHWILQFLGNGSFELNGILKVQVHYYEEGNVQLVSSKEIKESFQSDDEVQLAKELVAFVEEAENHYQTSISENYQTMSDTTFKALRRQLPVTRTKIDWNKIVSYNIAKELSKPQLS